ncbi:hypothetical protein F4778DRAFT_730069 [Xylariomycetidae sp. FL2044]|nr:hypothetical protein F4778DRAFT_730069 [Xylariomycetidae sp. FL2044]
MYHILNHPAFEIMIRVITKHEASDFQEPLKLSPFSRRVVGQGLFRTTPQGKRNDGRPSPDSEGVENPGNETHSGSESDTTADGIMLDGLEVTEKEPSACEEDHDTAAASDASAGDDIKAELLAEVEALLDQKLSSFEDTIVRAIRSGTIDEVSQLIEKRVALEKGELSSMITRKVSREIEEAAARAAGVEVERYIKENGETAEGKMESIQAQIDTLGGEELEVLFRQPKMLQALKRLVDYIEVEQAVGEWEKL